MENLTCFTIYQISKLGMFSIAKNMCIVMQPTIFNLLVPLMTTKEKINHDLPNTWVVEVFKVDLLKTTSHGIISMTTPIAFHHSNIHNKHI